MADDHLNELLHSLESSFDASVARAEEEAASDLALSLLQDSRLADVLGRAGRVQLHIDGRPPLTVTEVGRDYVRCERPAELLVPLERASYSVSAAGEPPASTGRPLLAVLRALVRARSCLDVRTHAGSYRGLLARACPDHIVVAREAWLQSSEVDDLRELHVPLRLIEEIQVLRGAG